MRLPVHVLSCICCMWGADLTTCIARPRTSSLSLGGRSLGGRSLGGRSGLSGPEKSLSSPPSRRRPDTAPASSNNPQVGRDSNDCKRNLCDCYKSGSRPLSTTHWVPSTSLTYCWVQMSDISGRRHARHLVLPSQTTDKVLVYH